MNRADDGLDKINDQRDQSEAKIMIRDGGTDKQTRTAIQSLGVGWIPGRRPASSFKSNVSVIAVSGKIDHFHWLGPSHSLSQFFWPLFSRRLSVYCADGALAAFPPSSL